MCPFKDDVATFTLHTVRLTLARFLSLKFSPSLMALRLLAASLHFPHMYPGVHTKSFVFSRFVSTPTLHNITNDTVRAYCTQMWYLPPILPLSEENIRFHSPAAHPIPCSASWET